MPRPLNRGPAMSGRQSRDASTIRRRRSEIRIDRLVQEPGGLVLDGLVRGHHAANCLHDAALVPNHHLATAAVGLPRPRGLTSGLPASINRL